MSRSSYCRRSFLLSAMALTIFASTRWAKATGFRTGGCFITEQDFQNITLYNTPPTGNAPLPFPPTSPPPSNTDPGSISILSTSNNAKLDRALGSVLVDLSREFGVNPGFGYYVDSSSKNALATPATRIQGTQGTVLFGLAMLNSLLTLRDGDIAIVAVCAHEFAHILQYQTGEMDRINSRLGARYCAELYADFFAGYFLRLFRLERPSIGVQGVGAKWEAMGSSDFNQPGNHGTSQQRIEAIEAGYFFADRSGHGVDRAMREAYTHVSQYG